MSKKKITGIVLLIAAVAILIIGSAFWLTGHDKSGIGILGLGVVLVGIGTFTFFSRTMQVDREWM